ncbi:MAG: BamA/OMP85 family outer membrane protein, partial [Cyclonatronaceae bacterium]
MSFYPKAPGLFAAVVVLLGLFFTSLISAPAAAQVTPPPSGQTNPMQNQPRNFTISSVVVSGAETRTDGMIIATAGLQEGEQITIPGPDIGEAIKRLHRTGLFADVQIFELNRSGGEIELEIQVTEQPRLDSFEITGPKRSQRRDLRDLIPLIPGFAVTDASRAQAERAIIRYFRDEGYRNTEVEIIETDFDEIRNRVSLEFKVDRGERLQIKEIVFEGNETFDDSELRGELKEIKRDTFWRFLTKQTFDQASYEEAQENLISFYQKNGFRDMRIVDDSVYVYEHKRNKEGLGVYMKVAEGPQYRIRNIEFEGNTVYDEEELIAALDFEKGDVYNQEKFDLNFYGNEQNTDVYAMYHDIGYLFLR